MDRTSTVLLIILVTRWSLFILRFAVEKIYDWIKTRKLYVWKDRGEKR